MTETGSENSNYPQLSAEALKAKRQADRADKLRLYEHKRAITQPEPYRVKQTNNISDTTPRVQLPVTTPELDNLRSGHIDNRVSNNFSRFTAALRRATRR